MAARALRAAARNAARAVDEYPSSEPPASAVCYLCLSRGDEPLVRNCACRGSDAGFAHATCLIDYAVAGEAEKPELWRECGLCKQEFFGKAKLALARGCWERAKGLPEENFYRLAAADDLAGALQESGDYATALPLFEEVLRVERRTKGDEDQNTLTSIYNLARLHDEMKNHELALPLAVEAVRSYRKVYGDGHQETLDAIDQLANVHKNMMNYNQALPLAIEALAGRRLVLGNNHKNTLASVNRLAHVHASLENTAEASALFEEDLSSTRRTLGDEHPETLTSIANAGQSRCRQGNFADGLPLLREALEGRRKVLGESHRHTQLAAQALRAFVNAAREVRRAGSRDSPTDEPPEKKRRGR